MPDTKIPLDDKTREAFRKVGKLMFERSVARRVERVKDAMTRSGKTAWTNEEIEALTKKVLYGG